MESLAIPLFPLSMFLLPGERVELHIFEPRYRQLLREVERTGMAFGIPFSVDKKNFSVGSLVKLKQVLKRYPSGELDIVVESTGTFRVKKFEKRKSGKLYPGGEVVLLDNNDSYKAGKTLRTLFNQYLALHSQDDPLELPEYELSLIDLASALTLNHEDKVKLIQFQQPALQERFLERFLRYLLLLEKQENAVKNGLYLS